MPNMETSHRQSFRKETRVDSSEVDVESIARRAQIEAQTVAERAESEREATRLSAELRGGRPKIEKVTIIKGKPSVGRAAAEQVGVATADVIASSASWAAKQTFYTADNLLSYAEKIGQTALKPFAKYFGWIPFFGKWFQKEPGKSLKEQDEEWAKEWKKQKDKDAAAAKKTLEEKKRKEELLESGLTDEQARLIAKGSDAKEPEKADEKKEDEKKAT